MNLVEDKASILKEVSFIFLSSISFLPCNLAIMCFCKLRLRDLVYVVCSRKYELGAIFLCSLKLTCYCLLSKLLSKFWILWSFALDYLHKFKIKHDIMKNDSFKF